MPRCLLLGVVFAFLVVSGASADGDPASDVLVFPGTRVYMTLAAPSPRLERELSARAKAVSSSGLPIKVAVIGNKFDLGAVPQLWGKPQLYAQFLGAELRFTMHDTLLVVMPQGFGVHGPYPHAQAVTALSKLRISTPATAKALTAAAEQALMALAASDRRIPAARAKPTDRGFSFVGIATAVAGAAGVALVGTAMGLRVRTRRRRSRRAAERRA